MIDMCVGVDNAINVHTQTRKVIKFVVANYCHDNNLFPFFFLFISRYNSFPRLTTQSIRRNVRLTTITESGDNSRHVSITIYFCIDYFLFGLPPKEIFAISDLRCR